LKRVGSKFQNPPLRIIGSDIRIHMLVPERRLQVAKEGRKLQTLMGQIASQLQSKEFLEEVDSAISSSAI
jgi:hypothetical protein